MKFLKKNGGIKPMLFRLVMLLLGNIFYCAAVNLFLVGNNIVGGGFTGVGTVLHHIIPDLKIGTIVLIMNIPFYIISFFVKGYKFTCTTFLASLFYSFLLNLTSDIPTLTFNPIAAAVFGGAVYGIGLVCLIISNSSVGGTDLVNRLLVVKFPNISVGKMSFFVDGSIVVLAMIVFNDIEVGLYAIITLYVCSAIADKLINGFGSGNLCVIVTEKNCEYLADELMKKLNRAVTKIDAKGMYSKNDKDVYLIAVTAKEASLVKKTIKTNSENAFVIVTKTSEFIGGGFNNIIPS